MSRKYEIEGHDISKFQQYYTQEDGRGFSLEDPPQKIYYFNKYGGWKDEIDGKVYFYDQDCNPWIENVPSDIDDPQDSQDYQGQEGASHDNQSDRYDQELQQDLKDYSASSDEEEGEGDEEEKALEEMTSSSEQDDEEEQQKQQVKQQADQGKERDQEEEESKEGNKGDHEQDYYQDQDNQEERTNSNHQTDESTDSERFREEYINELIDVIQQNQLETTCIHIEKIPADMTEKDLLQSFGVNQEERNQILHIFYGPTEKDSCDDNDEEYEEDEEEQIDVRNAVLVVSSKEIARQLVQNEGGALQNYFDRNLYLDVLTKSREYYPFPTLNDQTYTKLIDIIQKISCPDSSYNFVQFNLNNQELELFNHLKSQYSTLSVDKLTHLQLEISVQDKIQGAKDIINIWNYLFNEDKINIISDVNLI